MRAVWLRGPRAGLRQIAEEVEEETDWSDSTIQTLLKRCVEKGYLEAQLEQRRLRYTATLTWRETLQDLAQAVFDLAEEPYVEGGLDVVQELLDERRRQGR